MDKKLSNIDNHISKIREIEEEGINTINKKKLWQRILRERGFENERDKELYAKFRLLAEEGKEENDNRFRIKYVEQLGVHYDICIILAKKNVGKTYQIHGLINDCIKRGKEFMIIRSTMRECITSLRPFFDEPESKVTIRNRGSNIFDIVLKPITPEDSLKKLKKVGFACGAGGLTSYQGASYADLDLIIWDECISDGSYAKTTPAMISGVERWYSSAKRNKKHLKFYIFGNLLSKVNQQQGDPLLEHYGIHPRCGLKYIQAKDPSQASILFINCKEMFKGIDVQGSIGGVKSLTERNLFTNEETQRGIKTLTAREFLDAIPLRSLVFTYNKVIVAIHINQTYYTNEMRYLLVKVENDFIVSNSFSGTVYTNESATYNSYSHAIRYVDKDVWDDFVEELDNYCKAARVLYADAYTESEFQIYLKHLLMELDPDRNKWGKNKKKK